MPNGFPAAYTFATDIPFLGTTPIPQVPFSIPTLPTIMPEIPVSEYRVDPTGLSEAPVVYTEAYDIPAEQPGGYGPLELVGDVAKGAWDIVSGTAKTIADAGAFILENLEVGVGVATGAARGVGGIVAQQKQAEAQKTAAEAQKIAAEAYKLKTLAAQMAEPVTVPAVAQPLTYITPKTGEAPNYLLYIGLGILALIFLGKKL